VDAIRRSALGCTDARYYWLLLAESHLTLRLFADILAKVAMLPSPAG
jgi:hypothetical protein